MAMQFMDGVGHYDQVGDITAKWTVSILNGVSVTTGGGRDTGLSPNNVLALSQGIGKTLTYQSGWVCGWAVNFNSNRGWSAGGHYTLSAANETTLAEVWIESDGSISLYGGNHQVLLGNSGTASVPFNFVTQRWYYFEVKTQLSGSTPILATMTVRVNGIPIISGTGSTGVNASQTLLGSAAGNFHSIFNVTQGTTSIQDIYIADLSGAGSVNDFAGDIKIETIFTTANTTFAGWSAVGTGTGWNTINPQYPEINGSSTYIIDAGGTGNIANFLWQPVATFTGNIVAVHYGIYGRKDDQGTREFQHTVHGSTQGTVISPGDTYQYYFLALDQDPATGLPWTQANFDTSAFGVVTNT